MFNFKGKKVLVTGGTRGIGYQIAKEFARYDAHVVITGTSEEFEGDSILKYEQLVVNNNNQWYNDIEYIVKKYNGFDICINNAGINKISNIDSVELKNIQEIILVNLTMPIYLTSVVSKYMIKNKRGYIINIASVFGVVSRSGRNPYTASKSGLIGATKTIALDLAKYNILVNCISPGFIDTELTSKILGKTGIDEVVSKIPLGRLGRVEDITPLVLFLCSHLNTYITGQNFIIDGGFSIE
ncbi:TPA: SDR family NAD(P)-dependent oxidoreductase [Campylobacter coli]|nr:SDR family oxidoreductase [Campylobacter lari]EDP6874634.1 SDR family oxidoreductase [Campylobacter lari]EHS0799433.1 SDR family oxidoreductase [Campylobacter lari]